MQDPLEVKKALLRIEDRVIKTPVISSQVLNQLLGHEIHFKLDCLQHTGAFKIRGVFNHFLSFPPKELPQKIVGTSTGNHGIAMAFVANQLGMQARVYLPQGVSESKVKKILYYGAEVITVGSLPEALELAINDAKHGFTFFPSSNSKSVISGAGTLCYEALQQLSNLRFDSIFASCATGGMLAGSLLAKNLLSPTTKLFGVEPQSSDDGLKSIISGEVISIPHVVDTFADGLSTQYISSGTLPYLRALDGFFLVDEDDIMYWTQVLNHCLHVNCEPACAINLAAIVKWLEHQESPQRVLVLISGGNLNSGASKAVHEFEGISALKDFYRHKNAKFFDFQDHEFMDITGSVK